MNKRVLSLIVMVLTITLLIVGCGASSILIVHRRQRRRSQETDTFKVGLECGILLLTGHNLTTQMARCR